MFAPAVLDTEDANVEVAVEVKTDVCEVVVVSSVSVDVEEEEDRLEVTDVVAVADALEVVLVTVFAV